MHLNDAILAKTGGPTINQGLLAWYKANGATSNQLDDAERQFLLSKVGGTVGPELIIDPGFASTTNWVEGTDWVVGGTSPPYLNKAFYNGVDNPAVSLMNAAVDINFVAGTYRVEILCFSYAAGFFQFALGAGRFGFVRNAQGTTIQYVNATGLLKPGIEARPGASASFESLSMKLVTGMLTQSQHENDMWFTYLRSLGYTGSLDDMKFAYWSAP